MSHVTLLTNDDQIPNTFFSESFEKRRKRAVFWKNGKAHNSESSLSSNISSSCGFPRDGGRARGKLDHSFCQQRVPVDSTMAKLQRGTVFHVLTHLYIQILKWVIVN